ncbi:MAG: acyl carrier protein [Bacilli bacterium]|nr:acyl carrier protein [Bacilli bacterium]
MDKDRISEKVINIITEQLSFTPIDKNIESCDLVEDLGADSLDIVELITAMEEEFGIDITEEDLRVHPVISVGSVIELVKVKLPQTDK